MARFDELAQMVNERVDPSTTDAEIYVGLEHLDPDSLKLRRWGIPSDVIGDKLQFRKGDIIFGRRRAYQRKLAVAEFDGICSAHAMVVRANTETVEPEFLPFLMQSDIFMQRAIDISVGSLSPTINWKTLRIQEFPLPPKEEQRRIADILGAADEAIDAMTQVCESMRIARNTAHQELFDAISQTQPGEAKWATMPLSVVCEIANNLRKPINAAERAEIPGPFPYYGPTGILDHINEYRVNGEYVLIGEDGDHFLKFGDWEMTQFATGKFNVNNHAHIIRGRDGCRTRWVFHYFKHRDIGSFLARQGAGRLKLKKATLEKICLPVPPLPIQDRIISKLDALDIGLSSAKAHLMTLRELATSIRETRLQTRKGK